MSKDYTNSLGRVAPGSANPEVAVNDALVKTEAALTEVGAGALPAGGTAGQFLRLAPGATGTTGPAPAWADIPAELPSGGSAGQFLQRTADGVQWATVTGGGSGGGATGPTGPTGATGATGAAGSGSGGGGAAGPVGFGSHTTWRILCHAGSGFYAYSIAQIDFLDASGVAIPTTGAAFIASGTSDGTTAGAFDGDPSTYWSQQVTNSAAQGGDAFIGATFPAAVSVAAVRITARNQNADAARQVPLVMSLQYADDAASYKTAFGLGGTAFGSGEVRTYTPTIVASGGSRWGFKPPLAADFSDVTSIASAVLTVTDNTDVGLQFSVTPVSGDKSGAVLKPVPTSGNWSVLMGFKTNPIGIDYATVGLGLLCGGDLYVFGVDISRSRVGIARYNPSGGFNGSTLSEQINNNIEWVRVAYDATAQVLTFYISNDGKQWVPIKQVAGVVATKVGPAIGVNQNPYCAGYVIPATCFYWQQSW